MVTRNYIEGYRSGGVFPTGGVPQESPEWVSGLHIHTDNTGVLSGFRAAIRSAGDSGGYYIRGYGIRENNRSKQQ